MKLREIYITDYEKLISFWKENYFVNEMDSKDRFQIFLNKNPKLNILAENEGIIVGSALGSFDGRRGYLQKIVVSTPFRKKGIGKQLIETIIKQFRLLGCTYITLNVEKELINFYISCGFKQTEQIAMNMVLSEDGKYKEFIKQKTAELAKKIRED